MKILPALEEVRRIAGDGRYNTVPVSCEILSDFTTPIETLKVLKNVSDHCYMLESARADETWGRYTFLGFDPKLEIVCKDGEVKIGSRTVRTDHPSDCIREVLKEYRSPRLEGLPPFTGGLAGYFSYDYFRYSEPAAVCGGEDSEGFRDADLMLFDKVIAFDHVRQKIILIVHMPLRDAEAGYRKAETELKKLAALLRNGRKKEEPGGRLTGEITSLFRREEFCRMVEKAKRYIREGDIFQIVLSNRLSAPFEGSLLNAYRMLRTVNPSPYMFYFSGTDLEAAGASPETLVKLENGVLRTFPLAGTRRRGRTEEENRACQLIGELENNKRGIYGGAVGYIGFTGNMDACIAIRILYKKNGKVFVRSGAGIVADSVPEKEYEECLNKARASLRALELAQEADHEFAD